MTLRAMILAAGFGTRLAPITDYIPKPLIPVVGVPAIIRVIEHLKHVGVREIVINLHHLGSKIIEALGNGQSLGVQIAYSNEPEILGTGGGLRKALPLLENDTFIVVNGDVLFAPNLKRALDFHRQQRALATLITRPDPNVRQFGVVGLDDAGRLQQLVSAGNKNLVTREFMFTGVHILEPAIIDHLPTKGCIVQQTYMPLVKAGASLFGIEDRSYFCDLGVPARFAEATFGLLTGRHQIDGFIPPSEGYFKGNDCSLAEGVTITPGSVIGHGTRVDKNVTIDQSIIFDNAHVRHSVSNKIVLATGEEIKLS